MGEGGRRGGPDLRRVVLLVPTPRSWPSSFLLERSGAETWPGAPRRSAVRDGTTNAATALCVAERRHPQVARWDQPSSVTKDETKATQTCLSLVAVVCVWGRGREGGRMEVMVGVGVCVGRGRRRGGEGGWRRRSGWERSGWEPKFRAFSFPDRFSHLFFNVSGFFVDLCWWSVCFENTHLEFSGLL